MLLKKYFHSFESFLNLICDIVAISMYYVVLILARTNRPGSVAYYVGDIFSVST